MIKAIKELVQGNDLNNELMKESFNTIMSGEATDALIASFLTALHIKGETIEEITAAASVMRSKSSQISVEGDIMDIVGTGGDMANTFNISTISAIITAASGAIVEKHGNRSASSKCGSADVLEALGVNLTLTPKQSENMLKEIGLCFMFAPIYHSSMRHVGKARKEIKIRTIFNILGPLSNPANADRMLLGVFDKKLVKPLAQTLLNLGVKRAMVVHGFDHLDEITLTSKTTVSEVRNNKVLDYILDPQEYGFNYCTMDELKGGDKDYNKEIIISILSGEQSPKRDISVLNSGVALYLYNDNLSLKEGIELAKKTIDSKQALQKLEELIKVSQSYDSNENN